jgi:glycerophosphoryl diester phosphodiesterase
LKEVGLEKKALDIIEKKRQKEKVIVVSFHPEALARVRELDKEIASGLIYARFKRPIDKALELNLQYLVPLYRFVHRRDVQKAHKNNLKVIVWTINRKDEALSYIAKDVDGIATDRPDIFEGLAS